jgi:hypothetical protein
MLKNKYHKINACLLTVMLLAGSTGFGRQAQPAPDPALLEKFERLCRQISDVKGDYTLGGVFNILDKANPAAKMDNVDFLMCKQGNEFYYRLGQTITLNEQGANLYIDKTARRIMLSKKKQLVYDMGMGQFRDLGAHISDEHYQLVSQIHGDNETLSLVNEHHVSCKQYSIEFDRRTFRIKSLRLRLTNLSDPLKTDNEKIVEVRISNWEHKADLGHYLTKNKVIKKDGIGRIVLADAFKEYRLIKM